MNKSAAKGITKRALGLMLEKTEGICFELVYRGAVGGALPRDMVDNLDLLDDVLFEVIDDLQGRGCDE